MIHATTHTSTANPSQADEPLDRQYRIVKKSIEYLRANVQRQPSLAELAEHVHMSEFHLQRVFTDWAGISPKKFLQYLTKEYALQVLQFDGAVNTAQKHIKSIEQSALHLGLSGPSRLHDLMIKCVAMTPGEVKAGGKGVRIEFGFSRTPFGQAIIAWTDKGICHLMFDESGETALEALKEHWPCAEFSKNTEHALSLCKRIFYPSLQDTESPRESLQLLLKGTEFQIQVWEALVKIPSAALTTYSAVAEQINSPKAHRAVGSAIAVNTVAYLIPCHRVIRASGEISNYRWGVERKLAMIGWEASQR